MCWLKIKASLTLQYKNLKKAYEKIIEMQRNDDITRGNLFD